MAAGDEDQVLQSVRMLALPLTAPMASACCGDRVGPASGMIEGVGGRIEAGLIFDMLASPSKEIEGGACPCCRTGDDDDDDGGPGAAVVEKARGNASRRGVTD
jgi:hypothetical protein